MKRQGMLNGPVCWCLALLLTATGGRWLAAADRVAEPVSLTEQIPPWPVGPFVILRGGGVLAGRLRELSADRVTIDTVSCGTLDLPRAAVVGYRSSPRVGPQIDAVGNAAIQVALANGDRVEASSVRGDGLVYSLGGLPRPTPFGQSLEIPSDRVLAVDVTADRAPPGESQATVSAAAVGRWVGLEDGSRFVCEDFTAPAAQTPEGWVSLRPLLKGFDVPLRCPATEIAAVEPSGSRLRLALVKAVSGLGGSEARALTRGCSFTGDWPRLRGLTGFTAFGLHAPATVCYRFDRPAVRFTATVGIDDTAGQGGSVRVRIAAVVAEERGGRVQRAVGEAPSGLLTECFRSPILRGAEEPLVIDLPLAGVTTLQLDVEPADGGTVLDRTLWLDPQVWFE